MFGYVVDAVKLAVLLSLKLSSEVGEVLGISHSALIGLLFKDHSSVMWPAYIQ